jgi:predicted AlkP superfamily pyrophosphatase or phosphodiesterase
MLRRGGGERGATSILRTSGPIGLVACLTLGLACSGPADPPGRVLLVGVDGATLRIARPLLEEGRLPHLAAIASTGVYGPLQAHFPISSPRIWTSIATGRTPDQHGVLGFAKVVGEDERQLYLSTDRVVPALWNIASAAGLRVGVINWWNTYPIERVDGVIVSDHLLALDVEGRRRLTRADTPTVGAIAWPAEWDARLPDLLEDDSPLVEVPDPFAGDSSLPGWTHPERLSLRYQNDADVLRIALAVEAELHPDLMMVFFPGVDRVSHVLWGPTCSATGWRRRCAATTSTPMPWSAVCSSRTRRRISCSSSPTTASRPVRDSASSPDPTIPRGRCAA